MTPEQLTLLVGAIIGLLQVLTIAVGIWNKQHLEAVAAEQKRIADHVIKSP